MGKKSRPKGKVGEYGARDLIKELFYPNGEGSVHRTPQSGAWAGMKIMSGDLVCVKDDKIDTSIQFLWEVKNFRRKAVAIYKMLSGEETIINKWLKQATDNVAKIKASSKTGVWTDIIPVVMWRVDFSEFFIFTDAESFSKLQSRYGKMPDPMTCFEHYSGNSGFVCFPFSVFKAWVKKSLTQSL